MMLNLRSKDVLVAEQFLCLICDNMVIPKFSLGKDGIKKESIKIPQCETCDGLACYNCWKEHTTKQENAKCPSCNTFIKRRDG